MLTIQIPSSFRVDDTADARITPAEMLSIAEAYDAAMDIDDGEEAAHG